MTVDQQPAVFYVNCALFDVDGTIINSTGAISDFWRWFAEDKPHFDAEHVIRNSHGCRTFDVIEKYAPECAEVEYVTNLEASIPDNFGKKAKPVPGTVEVIREFERLSVTETENNQQRWAIVTSGTNPLATKWLKLLQITPPNTFITAELVKLGKPNPMGYAMARKRLGYGDPSSSAKVVVFEDAPAGIKAGKGAGAMVVGLSTTYEPEKVQMAGADIVVPDLTSLKIESYNPETDLFKIVVSDYQYAAEHLLTKS